MNGCRVKGGVGHVYTRKRMATFSFSLYQIDPRTYVIGHFPETLGDWNAITTTSIVKRWYRGTNSDTQIYTYRPYMYEGASFTFRLPIPLTKIIA